MAEARLSDLATGGENDQIPDVEHLQQISDVQIDGEVFELSSHS